MAALKKALKSSLNDLKLAHQNPRVYLSNYFTEFRNKIDRECQVFLKMETNLESKRSSQAFECQDSIINQVNVFEKACLNNIPKNLLNSDLSAKLEATISSVESKLENVDTLKEDGLYEIFELILNASILVQAELFTNRGIIFVNTSTNRKIASFGFLLVIDNTYVSQYIMDSDSGSLNKKCQFSLKHIDSEYIKVFHLRDSIVPEVSENDVPYRQIELRYSDREIFMTKRTGMKLRPNLFIDMVNLKKIDLSHTGLEMILNGFATGLVNLCGLDLSGNKIAKLEINCFKGLDKLKTLDLSSNKLTSLESDIFQDLTSLETLTASQNKLTKLEPYCFSHLKELNDLCLDCNLIVEIERDSLKGLVSLQRLSMTTNLIAEIDPLAFEDLRHLKGLYLSENRLGSLDHGLLKNSPDMEEMYLDLNKLGKLEPEPFSPLTNLKIISLSFNQIKWIPSGFFHQLKNLEVIALQKNEIAHLDTNVFEGLFKIRNLDISFNEITSLNASVYGHLAALKRFRYDYDKIDQEDAVKLEEFLGMKGKYHAAM